MEVSGRLHILDALTLDKMVAGIKWPVWSQKISEQNYEGNNLIAKLGILRPAIVTLAMYFTS